MHVGTSTPIRLSECVDLFAQRVSFGSIDLMVENLFNARRREIKIKAETLFGVSALMIMKDHIESMAQFSLVSSYFQD